MRIQYVKYNEFDTPTTLFESVNCRYFLYSGILQDTSHYTRPTHSEQGEREEGDDEVLQGAGGQPHVPRDLRVTGEYAHLAVLHYIPVTIRMSLNTIMLLILAIHI